VVGLNGLISTPAASAIIRKLNAADSDLCVGGILLTASHNPGGEEEDFGIKFNSKNGGPALESFTNKVFEHSKALTSYKTLRDPVTIDTSKPGFHALGSVEGQAVTVRVIDSTEDYVEMMKGLFDFPKLKAFVNREDFSLLFDGMHGAAGPYARRILVELFGLSESSVMRCNVLPDFGGGHPDPNLTYAEDLVRRLGVFDASAAAPDFGAACDGDADRNMILGRHFFVTPSDSIAVIAANARSVPYLAGGLAGVSRSMPTSGALDRVAAKLGLALYEVPTGWKFFGNLLDAGLITLCGEESFGTGSLHIREKDGLWAVLCWLSILADRNQPGGKLVSVEEVVRGHWAEYGRNYYQRYDYENLETAQADKVFKHLESQMQVFIDEAPGNTAVNFSYTDPVDKSVSANQGYIFKWADGSRFVFRLSGTGSSGATIRIYLEKFSEDINQ
jgi:phosphoglucomutase